MNIFKEIFKHLTISLFFSLLGLITGNLFIPASMIYVANKLITVLFLVLLILSICLRKQVIPKRFSMNIVYLFTFAQGILLYPTMNYYLYKLGLSTFISAIIGCIFIFLGLSIYAKNNDTGDIFKCGKILFFILIGITITTLINIFLHSTMLSIVISASGVLLFSFYIIYDINLIKRDIRIFSARDKDDLSFYVLSLYLDFINLLLDLLSLITRLKDN